VPGLACRAKQIETSHPEGGRHPGEPPGPAALPSIIGLRYPPQGQGGIQRRIGAEPSVALSDPVSAAAPHKAVGDEGIPVSEHDELARPHISEEGNDLDLAAGRKGRQHAAPLQRPAKVSLVDQRLAQEWQPNLCGQNSIVIHTHGPRWPGKRQSLTIGLVREPAPSFAAWRARWQTRKDGAKVAPGRAAKDRRTGAVSINTSY